MTLLQVHMLSKAEKIFARRVRCYATKVRGRLGQRVRAIYAHLLISVGARCAKCLHEKIVHNWASCLSESRSPPWLHLNSLSSKPRGRSDVGRVSVARLCASR